ncbi:MAG: EAL domain-containing protein, partial [Lachnospiraceae bacterium]|nr:EAL domain-containing protein [Lachnospiraceae bacterium]
NMDFGVRQTLPGIISSVKERTREIENTGAKLIPRVCVIRYPEDLDDYEDIIHFGHEFYGLIPFERLYSEASDIVVSKDFKIENDMDSILSRAIVKKGFEMYYQPIYSVREKRFVSAEALIRLNDSKYGFVSPGLFIPAAESRGLILPIGDFVLEDVYRFIAEHDLERLGIQYIEVNLSVVQCMQKDLPRKIKSLEVKYGVPPEKLNFEVTETTYDTVGGVIDGNLKKLSNMGYSFSLDDYGTGYSNMQRVSKLPLKMIKIDKSLVDDMATPDGMSIMRNTIHMMKDIRKELVVEGVETEEAFHELKDMGCDFIQGFYFSKPLSEDEFIAYVTARNGQA